jgi:hypothetical protein
MGRAAGTDDEEEQVSAPRAVTSGRGAWPTPTELESTCPT